MTEQTKPSAGALRAARKLNPGKRLYCSPKGEREVAQIIDRETGVTELLEAAKFVCSCYQDDIAIKCRGWGELERAIKGAEGSGL